MITKQIYHNIFDCVKDTNYFRNADEKNPIKLQRVGLATDILRFSGFFHLALYFMIKNN
jgi:hypothetical protein